MLLSCRQKLTSSVLTARIIFLIASCLLNKSIDRQRRRPFRPTELPPSLLLSYALSLFLSRFFVTTYSPLVALSATRWSGIGLAGIALCISEPSPCNLGE